MWTLDELATMATEGPVGQRVWGEDPVRSMDRQELVAATARICARPQQAEGDPRARTLTNRLLACQWVKVLESLSLPDEPQVLELCAGGSDPVVVALDVVFGSRATYQTVNLNRVLAAELRQKTAPLSLEIEIIEDDARDLAEHFGPGSFDLIAFHHAVNDILETAVAADHGFDTRDIDWWTDERMMIEWLAEQDRADGLRRVGLPELSAILGAAAEVCKPGGYLVFDHWTFEHHLSQDWFPAHLFGRLIPLAREVVMGLEAGLEEVTPAGLDRQWWMVLRKR
jgi:hypothetical protein